MVPTGQGSFKLFRLAGIQVYLHWSWFLVAAYMISSRTREYSSPIWNALEYVTLFGIVLMHEFGHSLACKQVGGQASEIVLWPLGGVAYVQPPQRPGATLWSIAAGPLVNLVLLPILGLLLFIASRLEWLAHFPDFHVYLKTIFIINTGLLIFNLLPIFPLDGGQILWALLWFVLGRVRGLLVASSLGIVGVAGFLLLAFWLGDWWLIIMGAFILMNCWGALMRARQMAKEEQVSPRTSNFACPGCGAEPPVGAFWLCAQCRRPFDTFATGGMCPHCRSQYDTTACPSCKQLSPLSAWRVPPPMVPPRL